MYANGSRLCVCVCLCVQMSLRYAQTPTRADSTTCLRARACVRACVCLSDSLRSANNKYYRTDAHPGCQYYEGFRQDRTDSHPMQPMHSTSTTPPPPPAASCVAGFGDEQGHGCQDAHAEGEYHIRYSEKRDCLHHCVPGPIGLLPQLLLHLLYIEGI